MGTLRIDRLAAPAVTLAQESGRVVLDRCHRAFSPRARVVGLLLTARLAPREGVWLEPCASVHSIGMRDAIGVAFLDRHGCVIRVVDPLRPWRVARAPGARVAVEAAPGALSGLGPGSRLLLVPPAPSGISRPARGGGSAGPGALWGNGPRRGPGSEPRR